MKKLFALLLALALTLGACTVAVAEEPVTITFWHTYGDAETPVINDVIIPCRILNDRQCGRFPCPPLCTRVQGL